MLRKAQKALKGCDSDSDEESGDDVFHDLRKSDGLIRVNRTRVDSFSSVSSIYSADGGRGAYAISGKILVGVWFKNNVLFTRVVKAEKLAATKPGKSGAVSDPYVKTYLLPDRTKHTKRKTAIERKTTNPEFNEILKNKLLESEIRLRTLWLTVWDWDKFGRNKFLGEVHFSLSSMDLTDPTDRWYTLQERHDACDAMDKGKLRVAIKFEPDEKEAGLSKGTLVVSVKEAKGLPQMNPTGLTDSFVKAYLLPKRCLKKKTKLVNNSLNPIWNEQLEFKSAYLEDLRQNRVLELSVWDYDKRGCNDFIGCLRLGPNPAHVAACASKAKKEFTDSTEQEVEQWENMLAKPGEWVEFEHQLRSSIGSLTKGSDSPVRKKSSTSRSSLYRQDAVDSTPSATLVKQATSSVETVDKPGGNCEGRYYTKGQYPVITGQIKISLDYKKGKLYVSIHSAEGLASADSNGFSDPYVKIYLLPDQTKHSRRKTKVKTKTLNPVFDEKFNYPVSESILSSRILWLSVWDWDRFGKDEFLGEVRIPMTDDNLHVTHDWYTLHDKSSTEIATSFDEPDAAMPAPSATPCTPDLKLRLQFLPIQALDRGTLHVHVAAGEGSLTQVADKVQDCTSHYYLKITLLPVKTRSRKSSLISNTSDPAWNEKFEFPDLIFRELSTQGALQLTVFEYSCDRVVGRVCLGPSSRDEDSEEVRHWKEMLMQPGKWVEYCHVIKPLPSREPVASVPNIALKEKQNSINQLQRSEDMQLKVEDRSQIRRSSDVVSMKSRPKIHKNGLHSKSTEESSCAHSSEDRSQ